MTALEKEIQNLPKLQKISIMEQIWADLSKDEASVEIPEWHFDELAKTEKRIQDGKDHFMDWESAKEAISKA